MRLKPTSRIDDVAALAQVSNATVSRVLNGSASVDPRLRDRVQYAVARLRYRPHRIARSLRRGDTATVGLIISDVQNPFFTALVRGVESTAASRDMLVMLCNADGDPAREWRYGDALVEERVAGVIIASADPTGETVRALVERGVPVVVVDRQSGRTPVDTVFVDNRAGARSAAEYLVSLGHRDLGVINGPPEFSVARERLEGFEAGLRAHGLPLQHELIRAADFRQESGRAAMAELLSGTTDRLDAVFVAGDLMTLGALAAINDVGLRIPADLSVVGFDDMPWASALNPPLTTISQPATEIGQTAMRLLLERIEGNAEAEPRHIVLQPRLIIRASATRRRVSLGGAGAV